MEKTEPGETASKRRLKITDIIMFVVLGAVIIGLGWFLLQQLSLKHEVSTARATTDRVVSDIKAVKADDARSLGTNSFQKSHSAQALTNLFKAVNEYATGSPAVASQTVTNTKDSQNVGIVYKYSSGKTAYFIRVVTTKPNGAQNWQLAGLSGGNDQAKLENNGR